MSLNESLTILLFRCEGDLSFYWSVDELFFILLSEHKEKVSYEIIKHPHHSSDHSYSTGVEYDHHGGYGENNFNYRKRRRILQ